MQELADRGLQLVAADGCRGRGRSDEKIGLEHVHLGDKTGFAGKWTENYLATVQKQDWTISSTMIDFPQEDYSTLESIKMTGGIAPDKDWQQNRKLFIGAVEVTVKLGVKYLSMHAGFIDESNPAYAKKFYDRIKSLADAAGKKDIMLLLETGQETAEELRHFLEEVDHPAIGVNFDPANMILYDKGNPIEAVRVLSPWVRHIHIKDAIRTKKPGTWGTRCPGATARSAARHFLTRSKRLVLKGLWRLSVRRATTASAT